ncbi:putative major head subunit protein [Pandoraea anapnoica]|uniref:Putative major head subunit protein n=1 Tax=Pandoraea anapnoica TaxID=2508301 RepID=A0A5E5AJR2_9BURK|nr:MULTISPECIES: Mu-like prophage major head subunit gpT family protein [Pandoraea]VVE14839.1 putative major head subunit protein [Pandoraea iniqua]VVE73316.1 putative major head subunit protein [Pandoraea anapnoica]
MIVNAQSIAIIFQGINAIFNNAFGAAPSTWQQIAMKVPSVGREEHYAWLDRFPAMRKWVGDKHIKALKAHGYTVRNDDFEATVEVDRNDIEDDRLGIYAPQAQSAGFSAAQLPDDIVYALVNGGFENACYDGQYFFDTDHPVGDGVASNKFDMPLSISTQAAAMASYGAMRTAMRKIKDDEGRPLNVRPNILLVGPGQEDVANSLMTSDRLEDGKNNLYKGTATVVCDARIESDTAWFLLDATKPVRPFVYQERKAPVFVAQFDMTADDVFMRKQFKFGAEARAAGGYGFWQLAAGSTGTGH